MSALLIVFYYYILVGKTLEHAHADFNHSENILEQNPLNYSLCDHLADVGRFSLNWVLVLLLVNLVSGSSPTLVFVPQKDLSKQFWCPVKRISVSKTKFRQAANLFFFIDIYSMQGWTATTRHGVTWKRITKRLKHTGNLFRKNLQFKDVC